MSSTGRGQRGGGEDDFFVTPAWPVHRLLEAWQPILWAPLLEPSAGNGAIIRAVNERMPDASWIAVEKRAEEAVTLASLADQVVITDFLHYLPPNAGRISTIIGNPPFYLAIEFIERARDFYPEANLAFLLRLNFAASAGRARFMRETRPSIYVLPDRPSFTDGSTDSIEYAWFVWDRNLLNQGRFRVLATTPLHERLPGGGRYAEPRQASLFLDGPTTLSESIEQPQQRGENAGT